MSEQITLAAALRIIAERTSFRTEEEGRSVLAAIDEHIAEDDAITAEELAEQQRVEEEDRAAEQRKAEAEAAEAERAKAERIANGTETEDDKPKPTPARKSTGATLTKPGRRS